jgi:hypothetical protein
LISARRETERQNTIEAAGSTRNRFSDGLNARHYSPPRKDNHEWRMRFVPAYPPSVRLFATLTSVATLALGLALVFIVVIAATTRSRPGSYVVVHVSSDVPGDCAVR